MKNKKIMFIITPIASVVLIAIIILVLNNKSGHIYNKDGYIRGFDKNTSVDTVSQTINEIYGEKPSIKIEGRYEYLYERIHSFDGIKNCDAIVEYCFDNGNGGEYREVKIFLTSSEYSTDELYNKVLRNMKNVYGKPRYVEENGEIITDNDGKPRFVNWLLSKTYIEINKSTTYSSSSKDYQVMLLFNYRVAE